MGYYAGYSFDIPIWKTNDSIPLTPFISAEITQVSVPNAEGDSDYKSGITWAAGLLIKNWEGITIGLTYGEDRIGDKDYKYEGKGWISFMIGWEVK